jgi:hypothetical protein
MLNFGMGDSDSEKAQLIQKMLRSKFPPILHSIKDGEVTWGVLQAIDYGTLGYLLSCHLIIEHYLSEALKRTGLPIEQLNWDSARLSFNQKVNLLPASDEYRTRMIPCLKHLNKLRNNFSHDVGFRLTQADLTPFVAYLEWAYSTVEPLPTDTIPVLELFTLNTCAYFAGYIVSRERTTKGRRVSS